MTRQPSDRSRHGENESIEARLFARFDQPEVVSLEAINNDFATMNVPWQVNRAVVKGIDRVVARRNAPLRPSYLDKVKSEDYGTDRRRLALGPNIAAMVCKLPLQREDVVAVLDFERAFEAESATAEGAANSLRQRLTPRQTGVTWHITLPPNEIGEKLEISEKAAVAGMGAAKGRSRLGTKRRFMSQALFEEMVDVSDLSPISTLDDGPLTSLQKQYIINESLAENEKSGETTREILRVLGAKTMYEVFAMAARDGLIKIQSVIPNQNPSTD